MQRRHAESAALWLVGLALAYVLSIGPVARMCDKGLLPLGPCTVLYSPLKPLIAVPVIGQALTSYVDWWVGPRGFKKA